MCGRFALYSKQTVLAEWFSATVKYDIEFSYNIAPTQTIPAVISIDHERLIVPFRWGLIPTWYKEGATLTVLNNARGETVDTKPAFRHSFRQHRCLIIADGSYEWDAQQNPKQPYYIHSQDGKPFGMAGVWSKWIGPEKSVESCCIITLPANDIVSPIHERMPAIISRENIDAWLNPDLQEVEKIKSILWDQSAAEKLETYKVSTQVNKANFDKKECIERLDVDQ